MFPASMHGSFSKKKLWVNRSFLLLSTTICVCGWSYVLEAPYDIIAVITHKYTDTQIYEYIWMPGSVSVSVPVTDRCTDADWAITSPHFRGSNLSWVLFAVDELLWTFFLVLFWVNYFFEHFLSKFTFLIAFLRTSLSDFLFEHFFERIF